VLRSKDSGAPATYLQIAEQYSRDLKQQLGHSARLAVSKTGSK
jgi:hypothetical protein